MRTLITNSDEPTHFTGVFNKRESRRRHRTPFSCIEVEALAGLLRALGEPATADTLIQKHATDDETGDATYQGDTIEYVVPIDPMDDLQCVGCQ